MKIAAGITSGLRRHHYAVPQRRLSGEAWSLEPEVAEALYRKIKTGGVPLAEYAKTKPFRGILTGYNEAFFVDDATRSRLVAEDARSNEIIRKCLRVILQTILLQLKFLFYPLLELKQ